jgi:very-short-patch-repair endonuclease
MTWSPVARAQAGVVSRRQLTMAGVSPAAVGRMVAAGELDRLAHGLYLARGAPLTYRAQLWAAVLATDGLLGFATAAELWGVSDEHPDRIHVVVPHRRRLLAPLPIALHRTPVPAHEVGERGGLPVTARSWTVLDLLGTLPARQVSRLADRAVQRGWLRPADVDARLREFPHRRGNPVLRRLQATLGDGAAAESERRLHRLLRAAGLTGWVPNYPVWVDGELVAVVDVAVLERKLAIEVDGMAHHVDVDRSRRDRARQNDLVGLGWTVLRFTWADLVERPGYVTATIRRLVA